MGEEVNSLPADRPRKGEEMSKRWIMTPMFMGIAVSSVVHGDVWELNVGDFLFGNGTSGYQYQGDHAEFLGSEVEGDPIEKTVATVDLGALIANQSAQSIAWIRISDPGCNFYNTNPGSDIDLFGVSGSIEGLGIEYSYDGSNSLYQGMSSEDLATELEKVDFDSGFSDASPLWVSLGCEGSITMTFDGWPDPGDDHDSGDDDPGDDDPGDDGSGSGDSGDSDPGDIIDLSDLLQDPYQGDGGTLTLPSSQYFDLMLRFNEIAPTPEWVNITIGMQGSSMFVVPGPMGLAVFPMAMGLMTRRRRR